VRGDLFAFSDDSVTCGERGVRVPVAFERRDQALDVRPGSGRPPQGRQRTLRAGAVSGAHLPASISGGIRHAAPDASRAEVSLLERAPVVDQTQLCSPSNRR
jgi:hypothetical protein